MELKTLDNRQSRTVEYSYTEHTQILMPEHINGLKRMFGGKVMQWMDVVATVVARRHSGCEVTTASVNGLQFLSPAYVNETVLITGKVVYVGTASIEVLVEAFVEELSGLRKPITSAYFVMVAIDDDGKPKTVPSLKLTTKEQRELFEQGKMRAIRRKSGLLEQK